MNKFDDFLKKTIKAILNDIRMTKQEKCDVKNKIEIQTKIKK